MFGLTFVTMVFHEMSKLFKNITEDDQDRLPEPSPVHMLDEIETEALLLPQLPPRPRPKFLLRHRRRLAQNRAYAKSLIKSLPDDLKF